MKQVLSLYENELNLSTRTKNLLLSDPKINSLEKLLEYYKSNIDFLKIYGCGEKSNTELIELCQNIIQEEDYYNKKITETKLSDLPVRLHNLVIKLFEKKYQELSARAKALIEKKIITWRSLTEVDQFLKIDFKKEEGQFNIGKSTLREISALKNYLTNLYNEIISNQQAYDINDAELVIELLDLEPAVSDKLRELVQEIEHFPYFLICYVILTESKLYNVSETYIFTNYFQYHINQEKKALSDIAEDLDLTRERVRQLRNKIIKSFSKRLKFLEIVSPLVNLENNYGIDFSNNYLKVDNFISQINNNDGTNLSAILIAKLILLHKDKYELLGSEINYHNLQTSRSELNLDGVYIINKDLNKKFDTSKFVKDIKNIQENGVTETYSVGLKGFMSKYILDFNYDKDIDVIEAAVKLCTDLIIFETSFQVSSDEKIVFLRNKKRSYSQIVKQALQDLGYSPDGHHISVIAEKVKQIAPSRDLYKKPASIRSVVIRNTNTFVSIGRTSTYGLKKWQDDFADFRGGTIRDIVEEYLLKFDEPKHISSITEYVNNYRNTDEDNIRGNLLLDQSKTFELYSTNFIGLKNKEYSTSDLKFNEVNGGNFTELALKKYLPDYYESVINKLTSSLGLKKIQVKAIIDRRIKDGSIAINKNNILRIKN